MDEKKKDDGTGFTDVHGDFENQTEASKNSLKVFEDTILPEIKAFTEKCKAAGYPVMVAAGIPAEFKDEPARGMYMSVNYTTDLLAKGSQKMVIATALLTNALPIPRDVEDVMFATSMVTLMRGPSAYGATAGMATDALNRPRAMGQQYQGSCPVGSHCPPDQAAACEAMIQSITKRVLDNEPGILESTEPFNSPCGNTAETGRVAKIVKSAVDRSPSMRAAAEQLVSRPLAEGVKLAQKLAQEMPDTREDQEDELIRDTFERLNPKTENKPN